MAAAGQLSIETGLRATFIESTIEEVPRKCPGPFDMVYTTWGTICWLPDVRQWARTIASALLSGGELYFADAHPALRVLEEAAGKLVVSYDYVTSPNRPLAFIDATTYTGDPTIMENQQSHEWMHPLSAILGGLIDAGMTITMFREHEILPWKALPCMMPASERMWRLPDTYPHMPLSFSLRARKSG